MHERRDRDVFYIREFGYLCIVAEIFVEHVYVVREREKERKRDIYKDMNKISPTRAYICAGIRKISRYRNA